MILRTSLRLASLIALAMPLSACLQPLHSPNLMAGGPVSSEMSRVAVAPIQGYLGYSLKSELDFLLGNNGAVGGTRYLLTVKTYQSGASTIIDAATARAQSVTVQAEASFELMDTQTGKLRASGKTYGSANYDRSAQRFATIRAQRDAEERLGKALAERLRVLIAAGLAGDGTRTIERAPPLRPINQPWLTPRPEEPGDEN